MNGSASVVSETETRPVPTDLLDRRQRLWAVATGVILLGLLAVARVLTPSPAGMGTHQQLGLPPCTFDAMFGVRCPSCGMTTSWSHFTRGSFVSSWNANPGGLCLAVLAGVTGVWSLVTAYRGRYRSLVSDGTLAVIAVAIAAITVGDWMLRVFAR